MLVFSACTSDSANGDDSEEPGTDSFDRGAMLANWADNIIIPAFENFTSSTQELELNTNAFVADPSEENLAALEKEYESKEVLRPQHWGGYLVRPVEIEFWQGRANRLHDRIRYMVQPDFSWKAERLAP